MDDKTQVGALLKAGRRARGVRQSELADELGFSSAALSHVEAGKNSASPDVLRAYAEKIAHPGKVEALIRALTSSDFIDPRSIAELITPDDPQHFLAIYREVVGNSSRRAPSERRASSSLRSSNRMWSSRPELPGRELWHQVISALQDHFQRRGGKVVIPGREVSDFGTGFPISADIIELTQSLVIEVKTSPMFKHSWVPAAIGNAVLLSDHDFRFALCVTAPRDFRGRDEVVRALHKYGVQLLWAMVDVNDDGDIRSIQIIAD